MKQCVQQQLVFWPLYAHPHTLSHTQGRTHTFTQRSQATCMHTSHHYMYALSYILSGNGGARVTLYPPQELYLTANVWCSTPSARNTVVIESACSVDSIDGIFERVDKRELGIERPSSLSACVAPGLCLALPLQCLQTRARARTRTHTHNGSWIPVARTWRLRAAM